MSAHEMSRARMLPNVVRLSLARTMSSLGGVWYGMVAVFLPCKFSLFLMFTLHNACRTLHAVRPNIETLCAHKV